MRLSLNTTQILQVEHFNTQILPKLSTIQALEVAFSNLHLEVNTLRKSLAWTFVLLMVAKKLALKFKRSKV
jgi:hypothetical protein